MMAQTGPLLPIEGAQVDVTYARKHACPLAHLGWTDGSQTEGYYVAKRRPSEPSLASAIAASVDVTDARKQDAFRRSGGGDLSRLASTASTLRTMPPAAPNGARRSVGG